VRIVEVLKLLKSNFSSGGQRLGRPEKAEVDVYSWMNACWEYEASKRPKFCELFQFFVDSPAEYANLKELLKCQDLGNK